MHRDKAKFIFKVIVGLVIVVIIVSLIAAFLNAETLLNSNATINLPQKESIEKNELLIIRIDKESYTASYKSIKTSNMDLDVLLIEIQRTVAFNPDQKVAFIPEKDTNYSEMSKVLDVLKKAGYSNVQILPDV